MELNDRDIDLQKDAPTLAAIGKEIPFKVPLEYFADLTTNIQRRVFIESLRVDENDGFKVPDNYFGELTSSIENSVSNSRVKESPLQKPVRRLFTSWLSYAAAACITVMIATGLYFNSKTYNFNKKLSEVPDQEIINYLQVHSTAGDTPFIIETLNPEELEQVNPEVSAEELELYINNTTL